MWTCLSSTSPTERSVKIYKQKWTHTLRCCSSKLRCCGSTPHLLLISAPDRTCNGFTTDKWHNTNTFLWVLGRWKPTLILNITKHVFKHRTPTCIIRTPDIYPNLALFPPGKELEHSKGSDGLPSGVIFFSPFLVLRKRRLHKRHESGLCSSVLSRLLADTVAFVELPLDLLRINMNQNNIKLHEGEICYSLKPTTSTVSAHSCKRSTRLKTHHNRNSKLPHLRHVRLHLKLDFRLEIFEAYNSITGGDCLFQLLIALLFPLDAHAISCKDSGSHPSDKVPKNCKNTHSWVYRYGGAHYLTN